MVAIIGHFDGKVIVPDEPVDLPTGQRLIVHLEPAPNTDTKTILPGSAKGLVTMTDDFDAPLEDLAEYRE
jgi:hypothetical protein